MDDLKVEAETLNFASQEKIIRTNILRCNVNRMMDTSLFRLLGEKNQTSFTR